MKLKNQKSFPIAICMLIAFAAWTVAVRFIDVQAIGPQESPVGFATINRLVHNLTGVHMTLYTVTDWLSIIPLIIVMGFAAVGIIQWIRRKHLLKVDYSVLILGGFYIVVMAVFVLFEVLVINYRPVLIDGISEASYPSSTTLLVTCIMPTAIMQFNTRIKNTVLKRCVVYAISAFIVFMVVGRLISGVHWFTDIIGGILLSTGLVLTYRAVVSREIKFTF